MHYYSAMVGSRGLSWFGGDDRHARRLVATWIRLFWMRVKAENAGSIAHAINNGDPSVHITRIRCLESGVVPCVTPTTVDKLPLGRGLRFERGMLVALDIHASSEAS